MEKEYPSINIFIIYAREDKVTKQRLLSHLNILKDAYNLNIWHDEHIEPGQEWKPSIESRLAKTDLFLLLVSVDFMNSEFIHQVEFKYAIDRHKEHKSIVIPIIIKFCQWDVEISFKDFNFSLSELQVLPNDALPIDGWRTSEEAYNNIALGIRKVLNSLKSKLGTADQKEKVLWENTVTQNTIKAYQEYIRIYYHGKFEQEALKKIEELKNIEEERREKEKSDNEKRKKEDEKQITEQTKKPKRRFSFKLSIFVSFALIGIILSVVFFTNKSDNAYSGHSDIETGSIPSHDLSENQTTQKSNTLLDFRDISSRPVQMDDLVDKDCYQLDIMRNTIYAMHGYIFHKNKTMMDFFNNKAWYQPRNDFSFNTSLSEMERDNVNIIRKFEDQKHCP